MGVKWTTKIDKLAEMKARVDEINGRTVEVGSFNGDLAWLVHIHEYGTNITAKKAKYLTVPIHPDSVGKRAREIPDLFFFEAASGEKFLAKGEGDDLVFYYWLTKSVKIPERSFLRAGHDKEADRILKQTERAIGQVLGGKMSVDKLCELYGQQMKSAIQQYARNLSTPPNSDATILAKGTNNPLVGKTGQMIESIDYRVK